jgi:hypothetical protein
MQLDVYETIGVAIPGSVVVITAMLLFPDVKNLMGTQGVDIGGLGIFLVASFVAGHVVAAIGNIIESIENLVLGNASNALLSPDQKVIATGQRNRLEDAVRKTIAVEFSSLDNHSWRAVRREMYSHIAAAGGSDRIDKFNRTYGLQRGVASACLIAATMVWITAPHELVIIFALLAAALVSLIRMRRFAGHYTREIVVEFIRLKGGKPE